MRPKPHLIPASGSCHEHPPARFRRPRTRSRMEDRRVPAADQTVVRAGQCRHRAGSRMRGDRYRRSSGGDRFLQDATPSISSWSARRRRSRPASSTISRRPASRRSGRASRRRSSRDRRVSPRRSAREFNIPTGAYGRFTDALTMRWPMSARRARRSWSRRTAWPPARASSLRKRLMKPRPPSP